MAACEKAAREESFLRAIESESASTIVNEIHVNYKDIVVEESYDGPRLETEDSSEATVTIDFVKAVIERFKSQKLLHRKYVLQILLRVRDYFRGLPSLLRISIPRLSTSPSTLGQFTVCGDTHGQFYDLCNIFEVGGFPSDSNPYLFNGDFVDRGSFSFEVVFTLICLKLALPNGVYMLRGNHESKNMNRIYGFEGEVKHKYDESVMNLFTEVFNWLPLSAVIENAVFVVHGGLCATQDVTLDEISAIQRGKEPPEAGLTSDLLWSGT